jgi:hypothetical protein
MGAFASLAYTSEHNQSEKVLLQILDSAFINFESVCKQRARTHLHLPELLIQPAVNLLKRSMEVRPFNPFQLDLRGRAARCRVSTVFVYSESDEVIPW